MCSCLLQWWGIPELVPGVGLLPVQLTAGSIDAIIPAAAKSDELHPLMSPAAGGAVCVTAASEELANVSPSQGAGVKF